VENPAKPGIRAGEEWYDEPKGLIVSGQAKRGQAFFYLGAKPGLFSDVFQQFGRVVMPL
jgi:hypothetical protein